MITIWWRQDHFIVFIFFPADLKNSNEAFSWIPAVPMGVGRSQPCYRAAWLVMDVNKREVASEAQSKLLSLRANWAWTRWRRLRKRCLCSSVLWLGKTWVGSLVFSSVGTASHCLQGIDEPSETSCRCSRQRKQEALLELRVRKTKDLG